MERIKYINLFHVHISIFTIFESYIASKNVIILTSSRYFYYFLFCLNARITHVFYSNLIEILSDSLIILPVYDNVCSK